MSYTAGRAVRLNGFSTAAGVHASRVPLRRQCAKLAPSGSRSQCCTHFGSSSSDRAGAAHCRRRHATAGASFHSPSASQQLSPGAPPAPDDAEDDADMEYGECFITLVSVDNSCPDSTKLSIDTGDYAGLLRTIAWVLNGLQLRVVHATLHKDEGRAVDTFWVTTWQGKKLNDQAAALLRERMQDFVQSCTPRTVDPVEWVAGPVTVSNLSHPQWTRVVVRGDPPHRHGYLLELATVITGSGVLVQEGHIQGAPLPPAGSSNSDSSGNSAQGLCGPPAAVAPPEYDFAQGRWFEFLLSSKAGTKLDGGRVSALLFSLQAFTGDKHLPLAPPGMDQFIAITGNKAH